MKHIRVFIFYFLMLYSCSNESNIPSQYNGYAVLQTKDLPDDGVDLYTFYLLPKLEKKNIENKMNFGCQMSDKSVSFLLPQHEEFLVYKIELNKRGWNKDEDLILVKISYDMLIPEWKEYTKIKSKKVTVVNKDYVVEDYDFYNLVNNKGEALYRINDIEFIKKIN